jgi:glycosyltransferase involved in cell wall biosynthesis
MMFSVIIPVYNVEQYLRDCIDSVLAQTFGEWEAICVDDGSTDGSAAILKEYAERNARIKVITQKNAGTAAARNAGLKAAKGDYIFFLDSDDWIESNALQTLNSQLSTLNSHPDVLCFSGRRYMEATGEYRPADILAEKQYASGMDYYNENALLTRDFAFVCVVLRVYNREFLMRNNLFFADDNSFEDNLWVPIMLYHAHTVNVIPDSLYIYRFREGSKMHNDSLARKKDLLEVANRLARFFIPKQDFDKTTVYRSITHHYQVVFATAAIKERKELKILCNWSLYKTVSRTKLRHRINYWKNKVF